ncbi:hypothetical protein NA57DRAFT_50854 [Rhizodiscina lignyota]|uniref:Uncharacterized protein n=1 Tax=Rhizodiscina lignyota TaxID=1504668 RepID=A0A9P4IQ40_9PEZI|nr:hypothetical protein NA57DRAFT_50854 [Rhizodiscina lignyota]
MAGYLNHTEGFNQLLKDVHDSVKEDVKKEIHHDVKKYIKKEARVKVMQSSEDMAYKLGQDMDVIVKDLKNDVDLKLTVAKVDMGVRTLQKLDALNKENAELKKQLDILIQLHNDALPPHAQDEQDEPMSSRPKIRVTFDDARDYHDDWKRDGCKPTLTNFAAEKLLAGIPPSGWRLTTLEEDDAQYARFLETQKSVKAALIAARKARLAAEASKPKRGAKRAAGGPSLGEETEAGGKKASKRPRGLEEAGDDGDEVP